MRSNSGRSRWTKEVMEAAYSEESGNIAFRIKEGYAHDMTVMQRWNIPIMVLCGSGTKSKIRKIKYLSFLK